MSKQVFKIVDNDSDSEILLSLDLDRVTQEDMHEVTQFWASSERVLAAHQGDTIKSYLAYCASLLLMYLIAGKDGFQALKELETEEGFPGKNHGLEILSYETPQISSAAYLSISKLADKQL